MSYFKENNIKLQVPQAGEVRVLLEDFTYNSDKDGGIVIKAGLDTDLGSIPKVLRGIFPNDGKAMFGYILHDFLYRDGRFSRNKSDDILEEAMKTLGVSWWRRKSVRWGLKIGGGSAWKRHRGNDAKKDA